MNHTLEKAAVERQRRRLIVKSKVMKFEHHKWNSLYCKQLHTQHIESTHNNIDRDRYIDEQRDKICNDHFMYLAKTEMCAMFVSLFIFFFSGLHGALWVFCLIESSALSKVG